MKKVNKLVSLALALVMCLTLAVPAMAAEGISPRSDTLHYNIMEKQYLISSNVREMVKLVPGTTGKGRSEIVVTTSNSYTASFDIGSVISGVLTKGAAIKSGLFTLSVTGGVTVSQTFPVSQPDRFSAIGIFKYYNTYRVKEYYVIDYGTSMSKTEKGYGNVNEPIRVSYELTYDV